MYHLIVRRMVRQGFRDLSAGNFEPILKVFAPNIIFSFVGDNALGGERSGVESARQWFHRVSRLFPGLHIEPETIAVSGWPWNTIVVTRFRVRATLVGKRGYTNEGMQFLRLRWGKAVEDRIIEDTHKLAEACDYLAQQGVKEALAAPLTA